MVEAERGDKLEIELLVYVSNEATSDSEQAQAAAELSSTYTDAWTERIAHHGRGGNLQNHACTPGLSDERR
jgi:hypothetical protein